MRNYFIIFDWDGIETDEKEEKPHLPEATILPIFSFLLYMNFIF